MQNAGRSFSALGLAGLPLRQPRARRACHLRGPRRLRLGASRAQPPVTAVARTATHRPGPGAPAPRRVSRTAHVTARRDRTSSRVRRGRCGAGVSQGPRFLGGPSSAHGARMRGMRGKRPGEPAPCSRPGGGPGKASPVRAEARGRPARPGGPTGNGACGHARGEGRARGGGLGLQRHVRQGYLWGWERSARAPQPRGPCTGRPRAVPASRPRPPEASPAAAAASEAPPCGGGLAHVGLFRASLPGDSSQPIGARHRGRHPAPLKAQAPPGAAAALRGL